MGWRWPRQTAGSRWHARLGHHVCAALAWPALAWPAVAAQDPMPVRGLAEGIMHDVTGFAGFCLVVGLASFSVFAALFHLGWSRRWSLRETALHRELAALRARLDRAELFLAAEPQILIAWGGAGEEAEIEGDTGLVAAIADPRRRLDFSSWLPPRSVQRLEPLVARLRQHGEAFRLSVKSVAGQHLEIDGRPVNGCAVMRIRDVSGDRLEVARLNELQAQTKQDLAAFQAMLDALPNPAWVRGGDNCLTWVNAAYARAVEAEDQGEVVARGIEFLEHPAREAIALSRRAGEAWRGRAAATAAGERRTFEIVDAPAATAAVGMALDVSEILSMRVTLKREIEAHARTLDQLSTAVAIFDRSQRLVFHNAAYRQLFALDQAWLEQNPTDSEILDRLRTTRLLPEIGMFGTEIGTSGPIPQQSDFRAFKARFLAAYQSLETKEEVWYLPDGRRLRAVVNPNPQGGVTYLFDDVTERFHLESKFNGLLRVQGETLDTLKEGVAVFGSDGRLKFCNPAFAKLWTFSAEDLGESPHVDRVAQICEARYGDTEAWSELRSAVAGWQDQRMGLERRFRRRDGSVLDCAASPLPDGATLLTFIDMTASVNVEHALIERNQALIEAQKLRNDFVHHVSYELRSPLNTIIGFIQFLGDSAVGPLNEKQLEYTGYVMKSSTALLALIDDILDLASIDADVMELSLEDVDIERTIEAVAEGVQDRLAESDLALRITMMDGIGSFIADGKRIRQILFNLLSNAIGFSSPGQSISLRALRQDDTIVFEVSDQGRGIPAGVIDHVFDRFETYTTGSRHRGVGLGLSIVRSFVEMHGGRIMIDSKPGAGTKVTCILPSRPKTRGAVEMARDA